MVDSVGTSVHAEQPEAVHLSTAQPSQARHMATLALEGPETMGWGDRK